jgi:hypothetical protein
MRRSGYINVVLFIVCTLYCMSNPLHVALANSNEKVSMVLGANRGQFLGKGSRNNQFELGTGGVIELNVDGVIILSSYYQTKNTIGNSSIKSSHYQIIGFGGRKSYVPSKYFMPFWGIDASWCKSRYANVSGSDFMYYATGSAGIDLPLSDTYFIHSAARWNYLIGNQLKQENGIDYHLGIGIVLN